MTPHVKTLNMFLQDVVHRTTQDDGEETDLKTGSNSIIKSRAVIIEIKIVSMSL